MAPIKLLLTKGMQFRAGERAGLGQQSGQAMRRSDAPCPPIRIESLLKPNREKLDGRILRVLDVLDQSWLRGVAISELSAQVNLSGSRLSHLFKQQTGHTIGEIVLALRLSNSARLLVITELPVSEVCWRSGFADLSNFEHFFHRHFGCAPHVLRRRLRNSRAWRRAGTTSDRIRRGAAGSTNK